MELTALSTNGYHAKNIFPDDVVSKLLDLSKTFSGDDIHDIRGNPDSGIREVCMLFKKDPRLESELIKYVEYEIKQITSDFGYIYGLEIWRDKKGWHNPLHIDCLEAQNILIVYLDNLEILNGTLYVENEITYSALYKQNTGLVLLNSDKITHGMTGTVNETRHCLYISWITNKRHQELTEFNNT